MLKKKRKTGPQLGEGGKSGKSGASRALDQRGANRILQHYKGLPKCMLALADRYLVDALKKNTQKCL